MEQKTAIVIGASTGIGAATAEALAQQYKKIAITSISSSGKAERGSTEDTCAGHRLLCRDR